MARIKVVWGIDIGNCSLKALRCRAVPGEDKIVAEACDYIEYPQILTQPEAEPGQLVAQALQQFLSHNDWRGTAVAVSVAGQNGLARFLKLPPVETGQFAARVQQEAAQQIPFDLKDVVWDYQRMAGGLEKDGLVLEAEIGLFAMKRDMVLQVLEPFRNAGIAVKTIQLAPVALYNFLAFDQLTDLPLPGQYDPRNPPLSTAVLSLGTDASDLVVTNGFRAWQRSIPIGGNHFTKALAKEFKLTFAKAEHLKRNAAAVPDPKAVFQAMRPVFNDLLTEVQRSIGYFAATEQGATIRRVLAVGRAMKLPGLRRYLAQMLGMDVDVPESFQRLTGSEVLGAPIFKENCLCFPVCYGLALQGLNRSAIHTNLVPRNLVLSRTTQGLLRAGQWIAAGWRRVGNWAGPRAKQKADAPSGGPRPARVSPSHPGVAAELVRKIMAQDGVSIDCYVEQEAAVEQLVSCCVTVHTLESNAGAGWWAR